MIKIIDKKAERTPVIPPPFAYNAEITIEEDGKILYVHVCDHAETVYSVAEKSIYDYMTQKTDKFEEVDFIEEYLDEDEATTSKYAPYFDMACDMIEKL